MRTDWRRLLKRFSVAVGRAHIPVLGWPFRTESTILLAMMAVSGATSSRNGAERRPHVLRDAAAALTGIAIAGVLGGNLIALARQTWIEFVLPAYFNLLKSGFPWC